MEYADEETKPMGLPMPRQRRIAQRIALRVQMALRFQRNAARV